MEKTIKELEHEKHLFKIKLANRKANKLARKMRKQNHK